MRIIPISRDSMKSLKQQFEIEFQTTLVKTLTNHIYKKAIEHAQTSLSPMYLYNIAQNEESEPIRKVKTEIVTNLRRLFPGCSVTYCLTRISEDGDKIYDLTKIDPSWLPYINKEEIREYFHIDWT